MNGIDMATRKAFASSPDAIVLKIGDICIIRKEQSLRTECGELANVKLIGKEGR